MVITPIRNGIIIKDTPMSIPNEIKNEVNEILREQSRVEKISQYIADHLATDLSAAAVATKFGLSISSLQHIFKRHHQQTYQRYLEETRMMKAFELITKEGNRVQEAMYATGYKYKSTFNKAFKRKFKHPPGYFQK